MLFSPDLKKYTSFSISSKWEEVLTSTICKVRADETYPCNKPVTKKLDITDVKFSKKGIQMLPSPISKKASDIDNWKFTLGYAYPTDHVFYRLCWSFLFLFQHIQFLPIMDPTMPAKHLAGKM
jgi:hypothetical protein